MAKGIQRKIEIAVSNINHEIKVSTDRTSMYSRGLAEEGYKGGYRDALYDVLEALTGPVPGRNYWWHKRTPN